MSSVPTCATNIEWTLQEICNGALPVASLFAVNWFCLFVFSCGGLLKFVFKEVVNGFPHAWSSLLHIVGVRYGIFFLKVKMFWRLLLRYGSVKELTNCLFGYKYNVSCKSP